MKNYLFALTAITCISCLEKPDTPTDIETHQEAVTNNLTPFYSLKGQTKKISVQDFIERDEIPGVRIVFVEKGEIAWSASYGFADLEKKIKVDEKTVFTGASLSKPITTITALSLVEKGLLDLDENVNNKLVGWKIPENDFTKKAGVTLRNLIGHTSGLGRQFLSDYFPDEPAPTVEQILKGVAPSIDPPIEFVYTPGDGYKYSNPGYMVIEELITDVTDKKFEDVVAELVFKPSGMKTSSFEQPIPADLMETKAIGYSSNLQPYPYKVFPFLAAGGIWTTPDDLGRFVFTLLDDQKNNSNKMLSKEMADQVFNRGTRNEKLGFTLWNSKDDIVFRHTGHNYGFTSFIFGSVNNEQAIIVMANGENTGDLFAHLQRSVAEEYKWEYFRPGVYEPFDLGDADKNVFEGQFDWESSFVKITNEYNDLFIQIDNERHKLIPVEKNQFLVPDRSILITFPVDKESIILKIRNETGDYSEAQRIN